MKDRDCAWLTMFIQTRARKKNSDHHGVVLVGISEHSLIHAIRKYKTIKSARLILKLIMSWNS